MFSANKLSIDFRLADLDDVEVQFAVGQFGDLFAQVFDIGALFADDHAWTRGLDRNAALAVRTFDDHAADACLCALLLDESADFQIFVQKTTVFLGVGEPTAVPSTVDLKTQTDWIDFLTH